LRFPISPDGRCCFGHLADAMRAREHRGVSLTEPEPVINREDVVATMFMVADIVADVYAIRRLLEEDREEEED
jgi:hypothetical protein